MENSKNLFLAILLSVLVLGGWQYFYETPRLKEIEKLQAKQATTIKAEEQPKNLSPENLTSIEAEEAGKISIQTDKLSGSISLKGLRFDDLLLKEYKETLDPISPFVRLFSSTGQKAYFAEFGWLSNDAHQLVPDKNSIWTCNKDLLEANKSIDCYWSNKQSVYYFVRISVDQDYLFTIEQKIENKGQANITVANYGRIYKSYAEPKQFAILHEGTIGVFDDILKESTYEDLDKDKKEIYSNTKGSWAGFTNKYWLGAIVPDNKTLSKTSFIASNTETNPNNIYNVNYITQDIDIAAGNSFSSVNYLFAGAKVEQILSKYEQEKGFALFDRSIDFGVLYFLTKPLLLLINYLHALLGNFGLAIIAVTLIIKLLMYPLASKSYNSMAKMKELQPKIEQLKARYGDDKMKFNQEMMALYKTENINPAAGCLPLLIQIPIFFSLYKVIFISMEMRHAPFYGWIHDLSAPDPTSIWNLFGLMPWHSPDFLSIGAWPVIMGITMFIQQKTGPMPADPVQANVMKFMPLLLMVMLYSLPSGLMIYWSFSNILSILQQYVITTKSGKKKIA